MCNFTREIINSRHENICVITCFGGQWVFWGASGFSDSLAPRASGCHSPMSRPEMTICLNPHDGVTGNSAMTVATIWLAEIVTTQQSWFICIIYEWKTLTAPKNTKKNMAWPDGYGKNDATVYGGAPWWIVICLVNLKSQVVLLQTAHSWANAGVLLGARMHRERVAFETIKVSGWS